jgi:hypothetical protein
VSRIPLAIGLIALGAAGLGFAVLSARPGKDGCEEHFLGSEAERETTPNAGETSTTSSHGGPARLAGGGDASLHEHERSPTRGGGSEDNSETQVRPAGRLSLPLHNSALEAWAHDAIVASPLCPVEISVQLPDGADFSLSAALVEADGAVGPAETVDFLRVGPNLLIAVLPSAKRASHVVLTLSVAGQPVDSRRVPLPFSAQRNELPRLRESVWHLVRVPLAAHLERVRGGSPRAGSKEILDRALADLEELLRRTLVTRDRVPGELDRDMDEFIHREIDAVRRQSR